MNVSPSTTLHWESPPRSAWRQRLGREGLAGQLWTWATLPWGLWQHRRLREHSPRLSHHAYTCFFRSMGQLQALTGPVLDHLRLPQGQTLRIAVVAASNGAEVYSLAAWLRLACPDLPFQIHASDHNPELVAQARLGIYPADQLRTLGTPAVPWREMFRPLPGTPAPCPAQPDDDPPAPLWEVQPALREHVQWSTLDLLNDELRQQAGPADVVLANNVLFHLTPHQARRAFANLRRCLRPRAALFVQGADLGLRAELTREAGLRPLDHEVGRIHRDAQAHVDRRWWTLYWGSEPYMPWRPQALRRYSTIFLTP